MFFIQRGTVSFEGREFPHHWTEIYLDGEAFILDINLVSSAKVENRSEDIYFMPEEDAVKRLWLSSSSRVWLEKRGM